MQIITEDSETKSKYNINVFKEGVDDNVKNLHRKAKR